MTADRDLNHADWRKSSRSTAESNCVEVAATPEVVGMRDTKHRESGSLAVTPHAWTRFVTTLGRLC